MVFAIDEQQQPPADRTTARLDLMVDHVQRHALTPAGTCVECGTRFDIELDAVDGGASLREWQAHVMQAVLLAVIDSVGTELPEPIASAVQAARLIDDIAVHQVLASHTALLAEIRIALISYQTLEDHYGDELAGARADVDTLTATVRDRQAAIGILARELHTVRRELATHDRQAARDRIVRQAHRAYGRASAEIGRLRAQRDQLRLRQRDAEATADDSYREVMTARVRLRALLELEGEDYGALPLSELLTRVAERLRHVGHAGGDRRG